MKFSDSFLDEIRSRLPVSQIVARRVQLKRRGREFVGLSPFNKEKTPSFTVNDQKGFYHCFSSSKHGDIFTFVMETEGLSFPEAVERLAGEAGVPMPKPDPAYERIEKERLSLFDALEAAAAFFASQLRSKAGRAAESYAAGRGLSEATIKAFRIGFAPPSRDLLKNTLIGKGFGEDQLLHAGLLIKPDDGRASYDRFRNRLVIPILDAKSRVIGFGARTLDPDGQPKYLNSPETKLFDKGATLFNFARARVPALNTGAVIVVEGYMDVIALDQAGIANAVASLGTALTERQMQQLWHLAPEPVLCFDGDRAGESAAARAIDRMLPQLHEGHSFRFAFLPEGEDPDSLVREQGAGAFKACISAARPLIDVLWQREISAQDLDTPERRAALETRLEQRLNEIANARVKEHYRREIRARLAALWQQASAGPAKSQGFKPQNLAKGRGRQTAWRSPGPSQPSRRLRDMPTSPRGFAVTVILALTNHPWLLDHFTEEVAALDLRKTGVADLLNLISHAILEQPGLDRAALEELMARSGKAPHFAKLARESAFSRLSFLKPETPQAEVEEQFRDLLFRWRALPSLKQELLELADRLADGSDAEFEQFTMLQEQVANDGVAEAHEDAGDRQAQERFQQKVAELKRAKIGRQRGRRPVERR